MITNYQHSDKPEFGHTHAQIYFSTTNTNSQLDIDDILIWKLHLIKTFGVTYIVWRRMNRSQDFRFYMNENFPSILEGYYKIGETISSDTSIRDFDTDTWSKKI
ncbi:hypothetical protein HCN44_009601 [Aphidius gifuensis]|uniref:Uncharacterized protein n=1 Tax=Aphidius gifuensis TaxID=684658 RepID=A0A834Y2N9_APHGI|nr:hypothetical protein HCN44_009601 [Aphidius gifuensis]